MSIEFNCPACEKSIRAPDTAGGKYGKCPFCEVKVYIPSPPSDEEEIGLAPVDEEEEKRERELIRESVRFAAAFDKDPDKLPPEGAEGRRGAGVQRSKAAPGEVIEVAEEVEAFVVAMRDSKLQDADRVLARLKRAGARSKDYVEGLMLDPTPPPIGNVPKPLLLGFLKSLLSRLG